MAVSSLLALGKHTVSGMIAAGGGEFQDWSATYRLFEKERIKRGALFAPVLKNTIQLLGEGEPVVALLDDTILPKCGRKVSGASWRRDPLGPPFHTNFIWGQRFLQISAALPDPDIRGRARGIPIDFTHAPSAVQPRKNASPEALLQYKKEQDLCKISVVAVQRLHALREQVVGRQIICAVDGGYTNATVFKNIPEYTTLIGRLRKDAKLFEVPLEDDGKRSGRKRIYGSVLPTPEQIRQDDSIPWLSVEAFASGERRQFDMKTLLVRWKGTSARTVRLVVIRPVAYRLTKNSRLLYRDPAYLICTDPSLPLEKLLQSYLWRWEIELNFRDEKSILGVGEAHVRLPSSSVGVPALLVASYAFLLLAAASLDPSSLDFFRPKWYPRKPSDRPSLNTLLALFRSQLFKISIDALGSNSPSRSSIPRTHFYSDFPLSHAISFASK